MGCGIVSKTLKKVSESEFLLDAKVGERYSIYSIEMVIDSIQVFEGSFSMGGRDYKKRYILTGNSGCKYEVDVERKVTHNCFGNDKDESYISSFRKL